MEVCRVTFDRGTLVACSASLAMQRAPSFVLDPRTAQYRAPAHAYFGLLAWARTTGTTIDAAEIVARHKPLPASFTGPELRPYQEQAVRAWNSFDRRGVVVLPTGAGKTRVALSAIAACNVSTVILCPTRALVSQWRLALQACYPGPIGVVSDGERTVEAVTVMTFESGFRHLDQFGSEFGLVVVDEAHHFGGGTRCEALECCLAPARLGLTATQPQEASQAKRLEGLVGPVVFEMAVASLVGTHLAPLDHVHLPVMLTPTERDQYAADYTPFLEALRAHRRAYPAGPWHEFVRLLSASPNGREILAGYRRAEDLALFPSGKARMVSEILDRHARDRALAFVARTKDALALSIQDLIPLITADTKSKEREWLLGSLRDGHLRALVSARVLNEGIDLPDADVAILVSGKLGRREMVQRTGRVLRPRENKRATVYTLVSHGTIDERRFDRSWESVANT